MSELDNWFGPREKVEMPTAERSYFGRYPEVEQLCNLFLKEMEWGHDAYTIGRVAAGARDFVLAIGNKPALLLRVLKKMKRKKLTIGSPRSCITIAREMTPDSDSDEHRQKYLKGVEDEDR